MSCNSTGDTSCGCPVVSFAKASVSMIRSVFAMAAATMAGDLLIDTDTSKDYEYRTGTPSISS